MSTDKPVETEITDEQRLEFIIRGYYYPGRASRTNRETIDDCIREDKEWQAIWEDVKDVE